MLHPSSSSPALFEVCSRIHWENRPFSRQYPRFVQLCDTELRQFGRTKHSLWIPDTSMWIIVRLLRDCFEGYIYVVWVGCKHHAEQAQFGKRGGGQLQSFQDFKMYSNGYIRDALRLDEKTQGKNSKQYFPAISGDVRNSLVSLLTISWKYLYGRRMESWVVKLAA